MTADNAVEALRYLLEQTDIRRSDVVGQPEADPCFARCWRIWLKDGGAAIVYIPGHATIPDGDVEVGRAPWRTDPRVEVAGLHVGSVVTVRGGRTRLRVAAVCRGAPYVLLEGRARPVMILDLDRAA